MKHKQHRRELLETILQLQGVERLEKAMCKYDLCKYYFTDRIVNIWNSLPNHVVLAESVNSL